MSDVSVCLVWTVGCTSPKCATGKVVPVMT